MCRSTEPMASADKEISVRGRVGSSSANRTLKNNKPQKLSVRFAPEVDRVVATVPALKDLSGKELRQIYWVPDEMQTIRICAKLTMRDVRRNHRKEIARIDDFYSMAQHLARTLSEDNFETMMGDPSGYAETLRNWCSNDISGRGLERYVSARLQEERGEHISAARNSVVRMSADPKVSADELAKKYKELTRTSEIYARIWGVADAPVQDRKIVQEQPTTSGQAPTKRVCRRNLLDRSTARSCISEVI